MNFKKPLTEQQALEKMQRYCAYQDRCIYEVRQKLADMDIRGQKADALILALQDEQYLDDVRFARVYAAGKLKNNGWGKVRLAMELRQRRMDSHVIAQALDGIDNALYIEIATRILQAKHAQLLHENADNRSLRLARFAAMRGFEADVVRPIVQQLTR